jgi:hypothetical protein
MFALDTHGCDQTRGWRYHSIIVAVFVPGQEGSESVERVAMSVILTSQVNQLREGLEVALYPLARPYEDAVLQKELPLAVKGLLWPLPVQTWPLSPPPKMESALLKTYKMLICRGPDQIQRYF